jgi:uncharacterized protein (DUF427 family)
MSLTMSPGPLSTSPPSDTNYTIDGPRHRLLATPFPRRVRAEFGGATVFDTASGVLLHESNMLPMLYVPESDLVTSLLERTEHSTHCPFKGDASYWSITAGGRTAENAVWSYEAPLSGGSWLTGKYAFYWDRLAHWFDEDEEVFGHLRDPYHRVDVRPSKRVIVGDVVVAESSEAKVLSETALPNRWYLPRQDVQIDLLEQSATTSHCPYKGDSAYWSLVDGPADVAWSYEDPFDDARRVVGHLSFDGDDVSIEVTP